MNYFFLDVVDKSGKTEYIIMKLFKLSTGKKMKN